MDVTARLGDLVQTLRPVRRYYEVCMVYAGVFVALLGLTVVLATTFALGQPSQALTALGARPPVVTLTYTDYDHVPSHLPQTFKVSGSKIKVIA